AHSGRGNPAVALADDELYRGLPSRLLDPFADEDGERFGIAVDRPEVPAHVVPFCRDPAVAGPGRVDEDQVGEIEPGLAVRPQHRRERHDHTLERRPPRTPRSQSETG